MSESKARHTAERWLKTAQDDQAAARILQQAGKHAHACFLAQQAGEKAVKSLWYFADLDPWGHSIQKLLADFPQKQTLADWQQVIEAATDLDKYYIPTRYPNGLPDLTPEEVYAARDSTQAIAKADLLLKVARDWINRARTET